MIINKDTKLFVNHTSRGEFTAKARRTFSIDDDAYPLIVIDPMESRCARGEEIMARADMTSIELMEDEVVYVEETQPETEPENEIVIDPMPGPDSDFDSMNGRIASFGFSE